MEWISCEKVKTIEKYVKRHCVKSVVEPQQKDILICTQKLKLLKIVKFAVKSTTMEPVIDRFTLYDEVHEIVDKQEINSLIETENGYTAGDLQLCQKIGTPGIYGTVWKTVCKNGLVLASKLMLAAPKENINEVRINTFVTELVNRKISRHFLMTHTTYEVMLKDKKHFLLLNEMADGDLKKLTEDSDFLSRTDQVLNACIQCIISVATLHSYGFVHNDCHFGNFLFHKKSAKEGYYHYVVYGKDYYLKDSEYEMTIHDYSLITKNDETGLSKNLSIDDFRRVLPFFMLSDDTLKLEKDGCGLISFEYKELRSLSKFCQTLHYVLFKDVRTNEQKKEPYKVTEYILNEFLKIGGGNIWTDIRPDAIILNMDKPYIISGEFPKDIKKLVPRILKVSRKK
jgi:hypothetical protein